MNADSECSLTLVQAGPCVWNKLMAEGLALATCLGKLNIAELELFSQLLQLQPHQGGSAEHIHNCHTELKMHLDQGHVRLASQQFARRPYLLLCDHMQFPAKCTFTTFPQQVSNSMHLALVNAHLVPIQTKNKYILLRHVLWESTRWSHVSTWWQTGSSRKEGLSEHSRKENPPTPNN